MEVHELLPEFWAEEKGGEPSQGGNVANHGQGKKAQDSIRSESMFCTVYVSIVSSEYSTTWWESCLGASVEYEGGAYRWHMT